METFIEAKPFVPNPGYQKEREKALSGLKEELSKGSIDSPLIELMLEFSKVPHCFTLQCCYGHFVHDENTDRENIEALSKYCIKDQRILYRIAYLALCIQNNDAGRKLFKDLQDLAESNPEYIQFGSAEWFWKQNVNSYAIQVGPAQSKNSDTARIYLDTALHVEKMRRGFFKDLLIIALEQQSLSDVAE